MPPAPYRRHGRARPRRTRLPVKRTADRPRPGRGGSVPDRPDLDPSLPDGGEPDSSLVGTSEQNSSHRIWTIPNLLSFLRLLGVPLFLWLLLTDPPHDNWAL